MANTKTKFKWLFASIGLVALALWVETRHLGLTTSHDKLIEELRLARLEGLPVVPEDLRRPPVPDNQNAANLLINVFNRIKALPDDPLSTLTAYDLEKQPAAKLKRALAELEPYVHGVELVSLRPRLDMHWKWEMGPDLDFPELTPLRTFARWMVQRSHFATLRNQSEVAFQSLVISARVSHLLSDVPTLIALYRCMGRSKVITLPIIDDHSAARK